MQPAETLELAGNQYWDRALELVEQIPAFSPVLRRLLANLSSEVESASFLEIADLLEQDTMLTGKILGLVNSALYTPPMPILSVRRALNMLGTVRLRSFLLSLYMNRMSGTLRVPGNWSRQRLNSHALATGSLAELLAERLPVDCAEGAFVAGMFHDIGRIVLATLSCQNDCIVEPAALADDPSGENTEKAMFGFSHSLLSAEILRGWNLPVAVQVAVLFHEHPEDDPSPRRSSDTIKLSELIHAADEYVNSKGFSISDDPRDRGSDSALERLGPAANDSIILARFRDQFDVIRSLL